jgi:hypothetical protein
MIKRIMLFIMVIAATMAQLKGQDSSTYETQRTKINALLAERSSKFSQYDESLNARTGIFGFQTKKDIKNSNEILRQIALTDNEIFTQLKVLMDYKDLQVEEVKTTVNTNSERIQNYRKTIKQLQDENILLTERQETIENSKDLAYLFISILLTGIGILGFLFVMQNKKIKKFENENYRPFI